MTLLPSIPGVADRKMFIFLLLLTLGSAMSFQGWNTLYTNFAVQQAGLSGVQNGIVQSVRELPGLLTIGVIPLLFLFREHRLAALCVLVIGAGVMTVGFFPSWGGIMVTTFIMSLGFHYFEGVNQSLILQYFDLKSAPLVMGRLRGFTAGGNLLIGGVVFLLSGVFDFTTLFVLTGCAALVAGAWGLTCDPSDPAKPVQHRRMVLRRKYWLFYALTLLSGARRQIFVVFSVFLLVEHYGYGLREIAILFMVNNAVNWFLNPLIGRAINHFGERAILSTEYAALVVLFVAYALIDDPWVAGALYVLDHVLFNFAIAVRTFFQKIADLPDIAPSMAMGVTINHIAAVVIPACGGMLWMLDYRIPFFAGAGLALCSLVLTRFIDGELVKNGAKPA